MTVTGRPWDEIEDTLTAPRLEALRLEWLEHPPVGDLVAQYIGYKPPPPPQKIEHQISSSDPSGIGGLISRFPNGFVPADR